MKAATAPLRRDELPALREFLLNGFDSPPDAEYAATDVLEWKYFQDPAATESTRSLVAREDGRIVGHLGFCPTEFVVSPGGNKPITTLHVIDWLATSHTAPVGTMLMMEVFRRADTQYNVGGSEEGNRVQQALGYKRVGHVGSFQKTLRAGYWLRMPAAPPRWKHPARVARDIARTLGRRGAPPAFNVQLRRVDRFGEETGAVLGRCPAEVICTRRDTARLNHFLGHPRRSFTGWLLVVDGSVRGLALLNLTRQRANVGRIVECFLEATQPSLWHAAIHGLTAQLRHQGADVAQAYASAPWMIEALRSNGFWFARARNFLLRDGDGQVPPDGAFHLTYMEAALPYL